jgi:ABC-2 type transport system permease protein
MNRLLLHLHVARLYIGQALKSRMEYRADFFVECLAAALQQSSGLLALLFLFNNFHALSDTEQHIWSRDEVLFIYGFSLVPMAFFDAFAMSFYMFSDKYIVQGELDRLLLRPLSSLFQLFMEGISFDFIADLTLGFGLLGYAWHRVGPAIDVLVLLEFLAMVFGAWGVLTGVFLAMTSISFWSQDRLSFLPPVYNLLNFARYPLNIYRPAIRVLLTFIVPFGFVAFYPSTAFLKSGENFRHYALAVPFAGVFMLALGALTWRAGIRRYSGAGS